MCTVEVAEDAQRAAAVKLHAPHAPRQASLSTTATPLAQRIYAIAAASPGIYRGFSPTKEETTLDDTADFAIVPYTCNVLLISFTFGFLLI